jgi:hypothetical protein
VLTFDWQDVVEARVERIIGIGRRAMSDGSTSFDRLIIDTDRGALVINYLNDTAELSASLEQHPDTFDGTPADDVVPGFGKCLFWSWCGTNSQGAQDMFLLEFFHDGSPEDGDLMPRIGFIGDGAGIGVLVPSRR